VKSCCLSSGDSLARRLSGNRRRYRKLHSRFKVAALLVTLPLELVTTTLKVEPLSAVVGGGSGVTGQR